jgi:hypothetical protein
MRACNDAMVTVIRVIESCAHAITGIMMRWHACACVARRQYSGAGRDIGRGRASMHTVVLPTLPMGAGTSGAGPTGPNSVAAIPQARCSDCCEQLRFSTASLQMSAFGEGVSFDVAFSSNKVIALVQVHHTNLRPEIA